jgi:hypothetical protein
MYLAFGVLTLSGLGLAQDTKVARYCFSPGFAEARSGNYVILSAVGQSFVGMTAMGNMVLEAGFLADTLFRGIVVSASEEDAVPFEYILSQNYPNPFNPTTTIEFALPSDSYVDLRVYDLLGREVVTLVDEEKSPGVYRVRFDASMLSSGLYVYRLKAGEFVALKKLMLLK